MSRNLYLRAVYLFNHNVSDVDILSAAGNFKVEVLASSLYEAACLAIRALREDPFVPAGFAPEKSTIQVQVKRPAVWHTFPAEKVSAFVESTAAPNEMAERQRLRAILKSEDD